jgi:arylformamidase
LPTLAEHSMTRQDAQWLDTQYNNRARIPEHPQIFARWAAASQHAREHATVHPDLPYGEGPNETLDVFPSAAAGAPVLVFIHGGWWRSLDKSDHSFLAPPFVVRGAMVVVPNYALCPAVSIEEIALQMVRALAWTYRNAARYGGDPGRIVVAGHSAGAHLAAMLLCCRWSGVSPDLPQRLVHSALAISGVFDLDPIRRTPFLQVDLHLSPPAVRRLSPLRFPPPAGRLFAVVGGDESDEFLRQNRLLREAWGRRSVPVCERVAGANHLTVLDTLADPGARLHALACRLLDTA